MIQRQNNVQIYIFLKHPFKIRFEPHSEPLMLAGDTEKVTVVRMPSSVKVTQTLPTLSELLFACCRCCCCWSRWSQGRWRSGGGDGPAVISAEEAGVGADNKYPCVENKT